MTSNISDNRQEKEHKEDMQFWDEMLVDDDSDDNIVRKLGLMKTSSMLGARWSHILLRWDDHVKKLFNEKSLQEHII